MKCNGIDTAQTFGPFMRRSTHVHCTARDINTNEKKNGPTTLPIKRITFNVHTTHDTFIIHSHMFHALVSEKNRAAQVSYDFLVDYFARASESLSPTMSIESEMEEEKKGEKKVLGEMIGGYQEIIIATLHSDGTPVIAQNDLYTSHSELQSCHISVNNDMEYDSEYNEYRWCILKHHNNGTQFLPSNPLMYLYIANG